MEKLSDPCGDHLGAATDVIAKRKVGCDGSLVLVGQPEVNSFGAFRERNREHSST